MAKRGWEDVEQGKGGINGNGKKFKLVMNNQYNLQTMYYRITHLKTI